MAVPNDCVVYEYLQNMDYRLESQMIEYERRYALRKLDMLDHLELIALLAQREMFDKMYHDIVQLMRFARSY